jgi:serine/threonine protein kinase
MPLMRGGNLATMVENVASITPEIRKTRIRYMHQIAQGLAGIHRLNSSHNDVKLENCFYDPEHDEAVLGDIGETRELGRLANAGTYPSPEKAKSDGGYIQAPAARRNDCWAFGMMFYAMLYGPGAFEQIRKARWDNPAAEVAKTAADIVAKLNTQDPADTIIIDLLMIDPTKRPQMDEIVRRLGALLV